MTVLIPRTMSTQHPDNINMPSFVSGDCFTGEDEIREALWIFSLGCQEQMWDQEGKEVDPLVAEKLLSRYGDFFRTNRLGQKVFLTPRIPNPTVDPLAGAKLPQILANIPYSSMAAKVFYGEELPPMFEVILPMTTSADELDRIYHYYLKFAAVSQCLGDFHPEKINLIPLFEDMNSLLNSHQIVEDYLLDKEVEYQRVFLARSDPALNYGALSAVLLLNVALQRLHGLEKKIGIPIYPILGAGSPPFRGNFKPIDVESMLSGYASCQTFTIQSSFKYDWPEDIVAKAIGKINSARRGEPMPVDEEKSIKLIQKTTSAYQEQIPEIAILVNKISPFIPCSRLRKLHIGLFGYSRETSGVRLPRAITFCASLYSLGLPPETLGLYCLKTEDLSAVKEIYPSPNFEKDMRDALAFYNPEILSLLSPEAGRQIEKVLRITDFKPNMEHREITSQIIECLRKNQTAPLGKLIVEAGLLRKFLG